MFPGASSLDTPGTRSLEPDRKATTTGDPGREDATATVGASSPRSQASPAGVPAPSRRPTSPTVPVARSNRYTVESGEASPGARSVASLTNATQRPSRDTDAPVDRAFPGAPAGVRDASTVVLAARSRTKTCSCPETAPGTSPSEVLVNATTDPSALVVRAGPSVA